MRWFNLGRVWTLASVSFSYGFLSESMKNEIGISNVINKTGAPIVQIIDTPHRKPDHKRKGQETWNPTFSRVKFTAW